jgi:hypothetical protein
MLSELIAPPLLVLTLSHSYSQKRVKLQQGLSIAQAIIIESVESTHPQVQQSWMEELMGRSEPGTLVNYLFLYLACCAS